MRPLRRPSALLLACGLAGCLPAGDSPVGRHLVHDRTLSGVFLSPSEQAGVPSYVLTSGPTFHPGLATASPYDVLADIYQWPDSGAPMANGLAGMTPVIAGLYFLDIDPTRYTFASDARGRLLYADLDIQLDPTLPLTGGSVYRLSRLDLATGVAEWFTHLSLTQGIYANTDPRLRTQPFLLSPGRTRVYVAHSGTAQVIDLAGEYFLSAGRDGLFIGEDFYCAGLDELPASAASEIIRIRPDGRYDVPFSSDGQLGIAGVVWAPVPQLVLTLQRDTVWLPFAMLDTASLQTRNFPENKGEAELVSSSPNGQFLLFRAAITTGTVTHPTEYRFFIYDWIRGGLAVVDSSVIGKGLGGDAEWRPGTSELWLWTLPTGLAIWRPDGEPVLLDAQPYRHFPAQGPISLFTGDGRHWFAQGSEPLLRLYVGSADDPSAPLFPLHPEGTHSGHTWLLDDGRLIVEAWPSHVERNDLYLVDADARTVRALGTAGQVVAAGRDRALTLLNWSVARASGDLVLADYASGAHTVLAHDVYAVDVDRGPSANVPAGTDALAPGTRVALLSRNRLPSRDDGLWVLELP